MERLEDEPLTGEVFANEIEYYLQEFCEQRKPPIEDMTTAPQGVWNAALIYVYNNLSKGTNKLKVNGKLTGYHNNDYDSIYSNVNNSNCNAYNIDIIDQLCDYYIYISNLYNKGVTISGFSKLTGIREQTIYGWGKDERKLSNSAFYVYKKLNEEYENSLEAKLWSNKNPVAHIVIGKRRFGWESPEAGHQEGDRKALTAADIRARLSDSKHAETLDIVDGG